LQLDAVAVDAAAALGDPAAGLPRWNAPSAAFTVAARR
jgi:hypothetical protein